MGKGKATGGTGINHIIPRIHIGCKEAYIFLCITTGQFFVVVTQGGQATTGLRGENDFITQVKE
jgi:hypothetical protein